MCPEMTFLLSGFYFRVSTFGFLLSGFYFIGFLLSGFYFVTVLEMFQKDKVLPITEHSEKPWSGEESLVVGTLAIQQL